MLTLVLEEAPLDCCQLDGRVHLVGMDCRHQETVPVVVNLEVPHWRQTFHFLSDIGCGQSTAYVVGVLVY